MATGFGGGREAKTGATRTTQVRPLTLALKSLSYLQAGYPGLYLVSAEDARVEAELTAIANRLKYNLCFWSVISGLVETKSKKIHQAQEPIEAQAVVEGLPEKSMILLKEFHLFLQASIQYCFAK